MIIDYEKGDLVTMALEAIDNEAPYWFAQGCNCQKVMGAGIAAQIKQRIPKWYEADQNSKTNWLGNHSYYMPTEKDYSLVMFNLYTQKSLGADARLKSVRDCLFVLNGLYKSLVVAKNMDKDYGLPIALKIPKIGCGIGGLKWEDVENTINETALDLPVIVVEYDG